MSKFKTLAYGALTLIVVCVIALAISAGVVNSAEKNPVVRYWISVSTEKSVYPGMTAGSSGAGLILGGLMGRGGGDSGKRLQLQLNSPRLLPGNPQAVHDIPPGQNMGPTLPLVIPEVSSDRPEQVERSEPKIEKPKMRMLIYWGCSETVRPGQPYVIDTDKMSMAEFARAFQGRHVSSQIPPSLSGGRIYADWPNRKDAGRVPADSSLTGRHFVHGNYVPDLRFSVDSDHDFMAPVEFVSKKGSPGESFHFQWSAIPTATGYFARAMGHEEKTGTMIIWTSSDVRETGNTLMNFLSNEDVRRLIGEKVVMTPSVTQCVVPKGVFKDGQGMIQFIAYGDELNIVHPAKPKEPVWSVKIRRKSTSMLPIMQMAGNGSGDIESRSNGEQSSPENAGEREGFGPGKLLKKLFGR